jgi:hypothetical protein
LGRRRGDASYYGTRPVNPTTLHLTEGVSVKVVSERLHHAKTSIAMDVYAHAPPANQARAVESIGVALFG